MSHIDPQSLRRHLSRWTTGVAVITTLDRHGVPLGKAANSFHSVSLDPPLVSWCVDIGSTRYDEWLGAPGYVVHVVSERQRDLVRTFASRGGDKFADVDWESGLFGMPLLDDVALRLECRMWKQVEAGDHTYLIAEVVHVDDRAHHPLLFHGGRTTTAHELVEARLAESIETGCTAQPA